MTLFSPKRMFITKQPEKKTMFVDIESRGISPNPFLNNENSSCHTRTQDIVDSYRVRPVFEGPERPYLQTHRDYQSCRNLYTYYDAIGNKYKAYTRDELRAKGGVSSEDVKCVDMRLQLYVFK